MIAVTLLLALSAPRDGLPPGAGEPRTGRCHMGECSWFAELSRETLTVRGGARLLRLSLVGGASSSGDGEDYANSYDANARVDWDRQPHDVWVLCSPALPAVMVRTGTGALQTTILNFVDWSPPVQESDRAVYVHACHGEAEKDFAERHGYRVPQIEELELSGPHDIFDHLR